MHTCKHCHKDFPTRRAYSGHLGLNGKCPEKVKPETPTYQRGRYVDEAQEAKRGNGTQ